MEETTTSKSRNLERFTNEVTPLRFVSVSKRPLTKTLATIVEEEKESGDDGIAKGLRAHDETNVEFHETNIRQVETWTPFGE
ncbi:hypothetical protein GQ457_13G005200 [Hibiscus cannabinus]